MPSPEPPFLWLIVRRVGAPWDGCPGFDVEHADDFFATVGVALPMLSYVFATFLSVYLRTVLTWGYSVTLLLNELVLLLASLAVDADTYGTPSCEVDSVGRPAHETAVATATLFFFAAHTVEFHLFSTVRERSFGAGLVVYYTLSLFGPLHLPSYTAEQVWAGVGLGALSAVLSLALLYGVVLRHRDSEAVKWAFALLGLTYDPFYDSHLHRVKQQLTPAVAPGGTAAMPAVQPPEKLVCTDSEKRPPFNRFARRQVAERLA